ncbi:acyltransferase [Bradyrhizobium sp. S69]|uniref:acyltransferase family protein n=1 Tax=Bradyrhizobium sp. S69 TaxID=1641856 RepID=UPI00131AF163|nr:acyltransferase [Bradyrhizobium sp. S69]
MVTTLADAFRSRGGNNFNLIRLIAALSVIYGHSYVIAGHGGADIVLSTVGFRFVGGIAVDMFFIISGLLVTTSMLGRASVPGFLVARALRIYPALIICVALSAFVLGPLITTSPNYWTTLPFSYFFHNASAMDYTLYLPEVFEAIPQKGAVNGPLWSIVMEVRLYIVTAGIFLLGILQRRHMFNALFLFLIVVYFLKPQMTMPLLPWDSPFHRGLVLLYFTGAFYALNAKLVPLNPLILMGLLYFAASLHDGPEPRYLIGYYLLLPYLVMMMAFAPGLSWFNQLGDYSYGVYLYGWPVSQTVVQFWPDMSALENTAWSCAISLTLAIASWHLVEKRALRLKKPIGAALYRFGRAPLIGGCRSQQEEQRLAAETVKETN